MLTEDISMSTLYPHFQKAVGTRSINAARPWWIDWLFEEIGRDHAHSIYGDWNSYIPRAPVPYPQVRWLDPCGTQPGDVGQEP